MRSSNPDKGSVDATSAPPNRRSRALWTANVVGSSRRAPGQAELLIPKRSSGGWAAFRKGAITPLCRVRGRIFACAVLLSAYGQSDHSTSVIASNASGAADSAAHHSISPDANGGHRVPHVTFCHESLRILTR